MSINEIHARLNHEADQRIAETRRRLDIEAKRRANERDERALNALIISGGALALLSGMALLLLWVTR